MESKEMYSCFSDYDMETTDDDEHSLKIVSNPATPCTPSTPASSSVLDEADRSSFSISLDSGIGSPLTCILGSQCHNFAKVHDRNSTPKSPMSKLLRAEHTNKEKQRRERIKDSCDQLRVLLPYIKGRKTDMASILEMCVDYIRIVNTCMPQSLQDKMVEILSKDPSLVLNSENIVGTKRKRPADVSKSLLPTPTTTHSQEGTVSTASLSSERGFKKRPQIKGFGSIQDSLQQPCDVTKEESLQDVANSKWMRIPQTDNCTTDNRHLDPRLEPTLAGLSDVSTCAYLGQSGLQNSSQIKALMDLEEQKYCALYSGSFSDGYGTAPQMYGTIIANKHNSSLDTDNYRSSYGMDSALFHYYPNHAVHGNQNHMCVTTADYVNPISLHTTTSYSTGRQNGKESFHKTGSFANINANDTPDNA